MLFRLLLLFIVVPLVELAILLKLAEVMGWQSTLALVIVTGLVGTWLARSQGVRTFRAIHESLSRGQTPTDQLVDAALILLAGAVLLTPGLLTDLFGLSLLIPVTRKHFRRRLIRWFKEHVHVTSAPISPQSESSKVIDSYVVEERSDTNG